MSSRDTRSTSDLTHLSVQQLIQPRGRGRGSRSPSPAPAVGQVFFNTNENSEEQNHSAEDFEDAENDMDHLREDASPDELRQFAERAMEANRKLQSNQDIMTAALQKANDAAASAAAAAAQAMQALQNINTGANPSAQSTRRKKPDLPAFDKSQIEIWVRRVEAAYTREGVTAAKDKFAFIESTIGVNMGPEINAFMFGDPTDDNWAAFTQHLIDRYGPTKQQRCSVFLDGIRRDGRRPTALLALIDDRGRDVTLDDLKKELILRELPSDIKKLLQDKTEGLDAAATVKLADAHFDKEGKPLNASTSISAVSSAPEARQASDSLADPEEDGEINYVQGQQQRGRSNNRGNNSRGNNSRNNNSRGGHNNNSRPAFTPAFGSRSASRPRADPTNSSAGASQDEMRPCYHHARDPNAPVCNGPRCPSHSKAQYCNSRSCPQHAQGGNGRGGRR